MSAANGKAKTTKVQFTDEITKTPPLLHGDCDTFNSRPPSVAGTDEEDYDDYDWSDEEDLVDKEAKFEKKMGKTNKPERSCFKRFITVLFSSLLGSTLLAAVLITPGILVHFYWFKSHPSTHRRYVRDNIQAWLFWTAANLVISWYIAMFINIIPILLRHFISLSWGHVSEFVKSKIEMYDSVKDTVKPAFYAASAYASWIIIFTHIYHLHSDSSSVESQAPYTDRFAQVVLFFFFLVLVWCGQRMLSHFIAFSFYHTAYKERIDSVVQTLDLVERLRNYHPKHTTNKSASRTPIFGSMGFSALSQKQHFNLLNGALHNAAQKPSALRENSHESDADDNIKETDRSNRQMDAKYSKGARLSWYGGSPGSPSRQESDSSMDIQEKTKSVDDDIEMGPISSTRLHSLNMQSSQVHLNPQEPSTAPNPLASPKPSLSNNSDTVFQQATRLLKNTALHDARNLTGHTEKFSGWDVNSAHEAKRLARSIYQRLKDRGRIWLIPSDFYPAFPSHKLAEEAFKVFDKDKTGDITRAEIKTILLKVYKERRILSRSMRDVGDALRTLDHILLFFAGVMLFFISLSVFDVNLGESLSSVYSLSIAASFIFKTTASSAFDSIMFLFVTHPYDTGDRVFIDRKFPIFKISGIVSLKNITVDNLVVKRVGLFATVFIRADGTETYYFNSQLTSKFIINVRRSGKTFENLTMQVAWTTPLSKLDALEKCLNDWLSTEQNRWFEPSTNITLQNIAFQRYLELTIGIGHNGNWQDWNLRLARKTAFHAAAQHYCRQLGIIGYEAPLPVVYADPNTHTYMPTTSPGKDDLSLPSSDPRMEQRNQDETAKTSVLGFVPPLADRSSHLMRARKSKKRKAAVGAGNV